MGYWGEGFFESDQEQDNLSYAFSPDPRNLEELKIKVKQARAEVKAQKAIAAENLDDSIGSSTTDDTTSTPLETSKNDSDDDEDDRSLLWDVDLLNPRFPALVREYLDNGVLAKLLFKYGPEGDGCKPVDKYGFCAEMTTKDHMLCLITIPAMAVGASFPRKFLKGLAKRSQKLKLFPLQKEQIKTACDEYVNGKPYHIPTMSVLDMANTNGGRYPTFPLPELETIPNNKQPIPRDSAPIASSEGVLHFAKGTCVNCGSGASVDWSRLKRCGKCKNNDDLYCSRGCQKAQRNHHECILTAQDHAEIKRWKEEKARREAEEDARDPRPFRMLNIMPPGGLFG